MTTYFISDLHLNADESEITQLFYQFCKTLKPGDQLYILGDFFNAYIGDDACSSYDNEIIKQLAQLSSQGITLFMLYGNRDFLMRKKFFKKTGINLLKDKTIIKLNQQKILLMHGDTLCRSDKKYLRYRKIVRNPLTQFIFLHLTKNFRLKIAKKLRQQSHKRFDRTKQLIDVTEAYVIDVMRQYNCDMLIHGHTHAPAAHQLTVNGKEVTRLVLGAWHKHAIIGKGEMNSIKLIQFP